MEDIVASADKAIKKLIHQDNWGNQVISLKTNQIRKFLTAVNGLTNKITVYRAQNPQDKELPDALAEEVKYLKVKIAYQVGRGASGYNHNSVKEFVEYADLIKRIDKIGKSIAEYQKFAHYIEALVAYHKFYGGKD